MQNYDLLSTNILYFKDNLKISRIWNADNNTFKVIIINMLTLVFYSKK